MRDTPIVAATMLGLALVLGAVFVSPGIAACVEQKTGGFVGSLNLCHPVWVPLSALDWWEQRLGLD